MSICLPGLLQLAGAVEIRFFLPAYLLVYYYVFAIIDYKEVAMDLKSQHFKPLMIVVIGFVMWLAIFGDIMSNNQEMVFLLNA